MQPAQLIQIVSREPSRAGVLGTYPNPIYSLGLLALVLDKLLPVNNRHTLGEIVSRHLVEV